MTNQTQEKPKRTIIQKNIMTLLEAFEKISKILLLFNEEDRQRIVKSSIIVTEGKLQKQCFVKRNEKGRFTPTKEEK